MMVLREQGLDEEEITARFHISVATVKQRVRLASALRQPHRTPSARCPTAFSAPAP